MSGITQRKKKKRNLSSSLGKKSSEKWNVIDVDSENLGNNLSVEGFMGLEELTDYNEEDLQSIISQPKKKKRRKFVDIDDDNVELSNEKHSTTLGEVENLEEEKQDENVAAVKPLTKKQKRAAKRKESYKLLLKERRRKRKEEKRQENGKDVTHIPTQQDETLRVAEKTSPQSTMGLAPIEMSDWTGLGVPDEILRALRVKGFAKPTPIQKETLPAAILHHKDIIGAAQTGSGKTLAFGIPLLTHIMELKERQRMRYEGETSTESDIAKGDGDDDRPLYALILTPTRELALQIHDHIKAAALHTDIKSAVVVGGLAAPKQERLLSKHPEIVIGTPGRLHKLVSDGEPHLNKFNTLRFLVIDECDRMLEYGHFKELDELIDKANQSPSKKQMFLFSATLTVPQFHKKPKFKQKNEEKVSELQQLVNKVGIKSKAKVIDLTTKHVTASMLQQLKVKCTNEEKEFYLLYFLMTHPGRTIVFVNSIAATKRLCSLLTLLDRNPLQLHAGKQQRQRLKFLDRFVGSESGLLVATDVAARGLDIPKVQNVVHFQLPVDPKVYIHRSGRTARAQENGLSFIIEGPEDFNSYKKISQVLKLGSEIPSLNVDRGYLDGIKTRVKLSKEIDKLEYKSRQSSADSKWMNRVAKSIDVEVDEPENVMSKETKLILDQKKKYLKKLLNTTLIPKGFSGSYPTRSGGLISLDSLLV